MTFWKHYHLPEHVEEALAHLEHSEGKARVVAGGTDLLLELQQGRKPLLDTLVDVTRIAEMTQIVEDAGDIIIGAAVTHTQIVKSPLLARQATCLVESCGVIGGLQVRNVGTLGGNVAHALPAGDGTLSLLALDAEAEVATTGAAGVVRSWQPVLSLFAGPGKSTVDLTCEIIVRFRFRPPRPSAATAFKRIMRPQGVALPILAMAVYADLSADAQQFEATRIAIGPAGPTPLRATDAEAFLSGKPVADATLVEAARLILAQARLRTSKYRASIEYRQELVEVLFRRAMDTVTHRVRSGEVVPEGIGLG